MTSPVNRARADLVAAVHGAREARLSDDEIVEIVEEIPRRCEHCHGSGIYQGANGAVTDNPEIDPCSACGGTGLKAR